MRVLDLDMDYFMKSVATNISEFEAKRLSEDDWGAIFGQRVKLETF